MPKWLVFAMVSTTMKFEVEAETLQEAVDKANRDEGSYWKEASGPMWDPPHLAVNLDSKEEFDLD